jgi:hypothetical protein
VPATPQASHTLAVDDPFVVVLVDEVADLTAHAERQRKSSEPPVDRLHDLIPLAVIRAGGTPIADPAVA